MRARILIVEDHDDNRGIARLLFEGWGFERTLAEDGERGIAIATVWRPDMVAARPRPARHPGGGSRE